MIVFGIILLIISIIVMYFADEENDNSIMLIGIVLLFISIGLIAWGDERMRNTPEYKNQQLKEQLWEIQKEKNKKKDLEQLLKENKMLQDSLYKLKLKQ